MHSKKTCQCVHVKGFFLGMTHLGLKQSNVNHMLMLCYCHRGWRIQWSIVPEVSEPMVNMNLDFLVLFVISGNVIKKSLLAGYFYLSKRKP